MKSIPLTEFNIEEWNDCEYNLDMTKIRCDADNHLRNDDDAVVVADDIVI